jgi:hypothetical protein
MSDNHAILIRALEASGSEREAQLARAILGDPAAASADAPPAAPETPPAPPTTPEIPSVAVPPAAVAAAAPAPGQLPEGILPLEELQRQEQDGSEQRGMSYAERVKANEKFCASAEYHMKNGSL